MQNYCWLLILAAGYMAGCRPFTENVIPVSPPAPTDQIQSAQSQPQQVQQTSESLERRFSDKPVAKMDAVEAITVWSQRYDDLSQKTELLRQANMQMTLDKTRAEQEIERLKIELQQSHKDIEQANALLQEAHLELTKWKADVLGYRDEMRQAQAAQLSALTKILRILGAETPAQGEQKETMP